MKGTVAALAMLPLFSTTWADPADQRPAITSVLMHRSACYGTCPVYTVEITSAGSVIYTGEEHVKVQGRKSARIAPTEFRFLATAIERINFFDLRDKYLLKSDGCSTLWTDNPTVDLVITRGSEKKHVSYYYGCRGFPAAKRIMWLSDTIDDVGGTTVWIGSDDAL